jgi:hypothetical protein
MPTSKSFEQQKDKDGWVKSNTTRTETDHSVKEKTDYYDKGTYTGSKTTHTSKDD